MILINENVLIFLAQEFSFNYYHFVVVKWCPISETPFGGNHHQLILRGLYNAAESCFLGFHLSLSNQMTLKCTQ